MNIAVHLSAFEPIGEVLGNSSPIVIPGFRNEVYKLRMPRKALSGHVWENEYENSIKEWFC